MLHTEVFHVVRYYIHSFVCRLAVSALIVISFVYKMYLT